MKERKLSRLITNMDEDLEQLWQKLQLTEDEEEGIRVTKKVFSEEAVWSPHCLLVSLFTRKSFNKEAFKSTMERVWKSTPVRKITEVGDNLFIFQFRTNEEREIVINTRPWNFDDRLVLVKPLGKEDRPRKELLTNAQLWVQIYGLPFVAMTENMGRLIGEKLGKVIEVKTDEEGAGLGVCLAVRVEIDVQKKLMRRMRIAVEDGTSVFVDFKYERLPAICYCCGIIGHNESDCGLAIRKKKEGGANLAQYGKWIRAPLRMRGQKERSGGGGRSESSFQFNGEGIRDRKEAGDDGGSGLRLAEGAVVARGKSVIELSGTGESRKSVEKCEFPKLSAETRGKAEGALPRFRRHNTAKKKV